MVTLFSAKRLLRKIMIPAWLSWALFWILIASFSPCGSAGEISTTVDDPVFPRFHDLHITVDPATGGKVVTYRTRATYPATKVLEFYDAFFHGEGWLPSYETCQRGWVCDAKNQHQQKSETWRHTSSWQHTGRDLKARVVLIFRKIDGKWSEIVSVEYRVWEEKP